jgi:BirA family biotin operon repressor/biotin-[acetyl-CoA-carboxylase] ligase
MKVYTYKEVASTQDAARRAVNDGESLPFAVVAETQVAGRGRSSHSWASPPGGLWLTLALAVPEIEVVRQAAMVAAHAVSIAIERETSVATQVKWPNDLLCGGRKVCGILAESLVLSDSTTLLIGIGLNVNNPSPSEQLPRMTSLRRELGHPVSLDRLTTVVLDLLVTDMRQLAEQGFSPFYGWIMDRLALRGRQVAVEFNGQRHDGTLVGISPTGSLLLEDGTGSVRAIDAGSIYEW